MATDDKDFKIKNGLVVQGTTATVNGNDILTSESFLEDLANVPNQIYAAVISEKDVKVRFCNEEPPAIAYQMVIDSPIPKETQRVHSIQIKLIIIIPKITPKLR